jgi:hypothetical protein
LLRSYLREVLLIALQSSWRAANGLAGAALGGCATIWLGRLDVVLDKGLLSQIVNWLLSFVLYAAVAWIVIFIFSVVFVAPFRLWKREHLQNLANAKGDDSNIRKTEIVDHDRQLASRMRLLFPENRKQKLVEDLSAQHAYWSTQANSLEEAVHFLASAEACFLTVDLQKLANRFVETSGELLEFVAYKFFVYPKSQIKEPLMFAMQPGLNIDREGDGSLEQQEKYEKLVKELDERVQKMSESYNELIRAFHIHLLV